jgi:hypothetical protein
VRSTDARSTNTVPASDTGWPQDVRRAS